MEHHVFAVWDFMSLLKALQRGLTCVELPWVPSKDREARRLINEIVLAEESDEDGEGGHASHFELYLDAMRLAGADTGPIQGFLEDLARGMSVDRGARGVGRPPRPPASSSGRPGDSSSRARSPRSPRRSRSAARRLIPDLFRGIVDRLRDEDPYRFAPFRRYLDRHVELDGDEHAPMALRMLANVCGTDWPRRQDARYAAEVALEARLSLWDGVVRAIEAGGPVEVSSLTPSSARSSAAPRP